MREEDKNNVKWGKADTEDFYKNKIKMIDGDIPKYNKYIIFEYNYYEASGGVDDISESFDTVNEGILWIEKSSFDVSYILDRDSWKIVYEYNYF